MNNESIFKTFGVATGVCVVCAIIVSFSSVALKGLQDQNKLLDKQVNVLKAAGLVPTDGKATKAQVDEMFKTAEIVVVDLATGAVVADADPNKVESDKTNVVALTPEQDVAKIKTAPKQTVVYRFNDENGALKTLVLPICGTGLWSRMNGFLSLNADLTTVAGLVFYDHGETPGLGGEISNPKWTAKWNGKTAVDETGAPIVKVVKGYATDEATEVDGISGATLTCNGVNDTIAFWLGDLGYGPYLKTLRGDAPATEAEAPAETSEATEASEN